MKIEHWKCQDRHPSLQLQYGNIMGVCNGHEGNPPELQTCDTRKANNDLKYNPSEPLHDVSTKVVYGSKDGAISSPEPDFSLQMGEESNVGRRDNASILNLNLPILKKNRLAVIKGVHQALKAKAVKAMSGKLTKADVEKMIMEEEAKLEWREYSGVFFYELHKRLRAF